MKFDPKSGREILVEHFNTRSLEGFGCEKATVGIGAAGALLLHQIDDVGDGQYDQERMIRAYEHGEPDGAAQGGPMEHAPVGPFPLPDK